ncbi:MAG TPA: hypothetical protein DCW74_04620 [Alteromonas australica]|jgi:hypothetical protein|uniref:Ice-binding protein C-terminal domain-containing protein n=1 Tax=Alteromonas australica TaxID=589873 RepID=A0A350P137_9ALTE|nr:hypothetical protein [Alteromonas australica]|tara:strand:- start:4074 stop:4760 length:687 start_codon:yes stop_codon:yes gene_type:complete
MKRTLLALCTLIFASSASATLIVNNAVSGSVTNDFEDLASGSTAGFFSQSGATYGEHFAGQTVSGTTFDVLSGTPTVPLTLVAASSIDDNIGILTYLGSQTIFGDKSFATGEGAISILLDSVSNIFGYEVVGADSGTGNITTDFFGVTGTLLGSFTLTSSDSFFGFEVTSGELIKGISIYNTDGGGIAYDNFTFNTDAVVPPTDVPAPATMALLGLGLAFIGARRRMK